MATSLLDVLFALEPVAWFLATIPLFKYSLRQPQQSRWKLLLLHVFLPVQCYRKADQLNVILPEIVWFVALTALCAAIHHTSALAIEGWTLSKLRKRCPGRSDTAVALKAWMNLRRSPLERHPGVKASVKQRARFLGRKLLEMGALMVLCIAVEGSISLGLQPSSGDFGMQHRSYFHWALDRQALLRFCLAFHWAWLTIFFSHIIHSIMAILFVVALPLDHLDDWPPLFGNPLRAYSLRRFWGGFWHKIAAPSQAEYGRLVSRRLLGLEVNTTEEKSFVALWVFAISGIIHALVNIKTDPETNPFLDLQFLLLNFCGGFAESLVTRTIPKSVSNRIPTLVKRVIGFAWVWLFFYCTVSAYQWPIHSNEATRREDVS